MNSEARIQAFVARLGRQRRWLVAGHAMLAPAVWVTPPVLVTWIVWPPWTAVALWCAAAVALAAFVVGAIRERLWQPLPGVGPFATLPIDRGLELDDRLTTWETCVHDSAMAAWLKADLSDSVGAVPPEACASLWGRSLRRLLWWIPLILLLFAWKLWIPPLFGDDGDPDPESSRMANVPLGSRAESRLDQDQGGPPTPDGGAPNAGGVGQGSDPSPPPKEGQRPPPESPEDPIPLEPDGTPPEDPNANREPPRPPQPLDDQLGKQEEFVVPQFVGDGESRKQMVAAAILEEGGSVTPPKAQVGGGDGSPEETEAQQVELQRAAEKALRSRHVRPDERDIVRRWFEALRTGGGR